ncbi:MAG: YraN family protein [Candidatus Berkelbacteria bacterium]|nr:YraN family protein [Candidatus Berkelbacteria bacterium]
MDFTKKISGQFGEDEAAKFLKRSGYKIIERNLRIKFGEIDILARPKNKKNVIVVVEVKTKSTREFGEGFEMVNYFKQKKLLNLAKILQTEYPDKTIRIDIISVDTSQEPAEIKHFESAVEEE